MLVELPAVVREMSRADKLKLIELLAADLSEPSSAERDGLELGQPVSFEDFAPALPHSAAATTAVVLADPDEEHRRLIGQIADGAPHEIWSPLVPAGAGTTVEAALRRESELR